MSYVENHVVIWGLGSYRKTKTLLWNESLEGDGRNNLVGSQSNLSSAPDMTY